MVKGLSPGRLHRTMTHGRETIPICPTWPVGRVPSLRGETVGPQPEYPWFTVTRGNLLEQGDLLRDCPRFVLPSTLAQTNNGVGERGVVDAVVLT
jgi:hypothetical protein